MRDYYLYNQNNQFFKACETKDSAIAEAKARSLEWRELGREVHYRVCYNGFKSVEVFNTRDMQDCSICRGVHGPEITHACE